MNKLIFLGILSMGLLALAGGYRQTNQAKLSNQIYETQQQSDLSTQNNNLPNQYSFGDYDFSLSIGDLTRKYLIHIPKNYDKNKATPLILAFHGGLGTAEIMAENYGLKQKSDQEGFIVAFPNGASRFPSGKLATWNAGSCCGYANENNIDDIGFVKAVIGDIKSKFNVGKIFATGMSNGGMLSHRLACEMSDVFTAIASVSGTNNFDTCNPKKSISILHIHGLMDNNVPYNGGHGSGVEKKINYVSVPKTISDWVINNKCNANPARSNLSANAYCDLYTGCTDNAQVKLCVIKDGGHSWPGTNKAPNPLEQNIPSQAISATDEIWNFFNTQKNL